MKHCPNWLFVLLCRRGVLSEHYHVLAQVNIVVWRKTVFGENCFWKASYWSFIEYCWQTLISDLNHNIVLITLSWPTGGWTGVALIWLSQERATIHQVTFTSSYSRRGSFFITLHVFSVEFLLRNENILWKFHSELQACLP